MPYSSAPAAGNDITAVGVGNIRKDALLNTETVIAGEAIAAYTTAGSITFPTVVYLSGTKWYKSNGDGVVPGAGYVQAVGLAVTAAAGDGSTFTVAKPGSRITTEFFPSLSGLTVGMNLFPSAVTPGGVATYDPSTMKAYRLLGFADSTTSFDFTPTHNSTLLQNLPAVFTSQGAISRFDIVYINGSGQAQKTNSSSPFGSGYADAFAVANSATTGAGQPLLCSKIGSVIAVNPGGWTPGLPVYTSDTAGQGSHTKGRFSRQIGVAIDANNVYLCPLDPNRNMIIEVIVAGDVWAAYDFLYKRSDGLFLRSDADAPESGIAEYPAIALTTCGTIGSLQPVALPGSILHSLFAGTTGQKLWNSSSPGGRSTTHPGLGLFVRLYGHFIDTDRFAFEPGEMDYLPTGIQERNQFGMALRRDSAMTSDFYSGSCVSFRHVMSNTPTSVVVQTYIDSGTGSFTLTSITRYGCLAYGSRASTGLSFWSGISETVGN